MPTIRIETWIAAPAEVCFDLARSVEAHIGSTSKTGERAVAGVTSGLLELGDTVTWQARHLGIEQRLTSKMTRVERPRVFADQMVRGAFASFTHLHEFEETDGRTLMIDTFVYRSPLGPLGVIADKVFLESYMRRLLTERAEYLKKAAEGGLQGDREIGR
jgi:ligand-binding SRPBCC domain-containing protein